MLRVVDEFYYFFFHVLLLLLSWPIVWLRSVFFFFYSVLNETELLICLFFWLFQCAVFSVDLLPLRVLYLLLLLLFVLLFLLLLLLLPLIVGSVCQCRFCTYLKKKTVVIEYNSLISYFSCIWANKMPKSRHNTYVFHDNRCVSMFVICIWRFSIMFRKLIKAKNNEK